MSLLSVVIPCYNASRYIVRCLEALEHQIFKDFDVILIDDCSTDSTVQVIDNYKSSSTMSIHLLRNNENSGPAKSRSLGISFSRAVFICFCDSDDWYDKDYLEEMVHAQSENNADLVFCSYRLALNSGKKANRLNIYKREDLIDNRRAMIKAPDSLCLIMVRREILLSVPHPDLRNGEDMAVIPLLVSKANTFSSVNKCMYNYYCRGNSASMSPTMKVIESLEESFFFIDNHLSSRYKLEKEYIGIRNLLYGALINLFKFTYDKRKANSIVNRFEYSYPFWSKNTNLKELPISKRVFLKCVKNRKWHLAKGISLIHSLLLK